MPDPVYLLDPLSRTRIAALYDDLMPLELHETVRKFLERPGWQWGWKSDPKGEGFPFWHKHFAGHLSPDHYTGAKDHPECISELAEKALPLYQVWQSIPLQNHTLVRCYANGAPYGCEGAPHTDSVADNAYTCIYYPAERWDAAWGGETVLLNEDKTDILAAIYPRPNRLAVFPGKMWHVARGVGRLCPVMRVTLMFKTEWRR